MSGTRIASVSGLRGIVGDGLDPIAAVEFAASYASGCEPGPIVVGHDGRTSASTFLHAVLAAVTATGRDALNAGPTATPTLGVLVRDTAAAGGIQISASHNPPEYNGLKFFQPAGMVLSPEAGRAVLDRLERRDFGWARAGALGRVRTLEDPDQAHLARVLEIVDSEAIRRRRFPVILDACHGAGGRMGRALLEALGCTVTLLGGEPDGRYDHPPEPTEPNLRTLAATIPKAGAVVGFAQDPDADRLAIIDENGRYIGEELTLALAAHRRLVQTTGPVVLNLSTSRTTEDLAREHGCPVHRTPVGEIHVVERMRAEHAMLGGEGNGGVIDPRVGFVRDSFVGMALVLDLLAATGEPLSQLADALPHYAMVKEKYPLGDEPDTDRRPLQPHRRRPPGRHQRPPRRPAARLARLLGPRPREQHRTDRPRHRRGPRRIPRPRAGRLPRPLDHRRGGLSERLSDSDREAPALGTTATFDHTADVGLRITGDDLDDLFRTAAEGLFDYIVANRNVVRSVETETVTLQADNLADLLVAWLNELIFRCETRHWLYTTFDVHVNENAPSLEATIGGEPIDRDRHDLDHEVKAVTHHGLTLERHGDGWKSELILDI